MTQFKIDNLKLTIKFLSLFSILSIVHFQFSIPAYAQAGDIGYSRIDPTSPFYFLKTIRENLEMKLSFTQRVKNLRQLEFATRRLRETKTLIGKNEDLITPTLDRYISSLSALQEKYEKNDQFGDDLKNNLTIHLQNLQQFYDLVSLPRAKMSIRMVMNRIIRREGISNFAKLPICNFFIKEASSSALNQTEQFVLKTRAQECISH